MAAPVYRRTPASSGASSTRVAAGSMSLFSGAPSQAAPSALFDAWALDPASAESVGFTIDLDALGWASFDVVAEFYNPSASAGDYVARVVHNHRGPGDGVNAGFTVVAAVTQAAGAQYVLQHVTLASGVAVVAGKATVVRVDRQASDAADTLANDLHLSAVILRKAS